MNFYLSLLLGLEELFILLLKFLEEMWIYYFTVI